MPPPVDIVAWHRGLASWGPVTSFEAYTDQLRFEVVDGDGLRLLVNLGARGGVMASAHFAVRTAGYTACPSTWVRTAVVGLALWRAFGGRA